MTPWVAVLIAAAAAVTEPPEDIVSQCPLVDVLARIGYSCDPAVVGAQAGGGEAGSGSIFLLDRETCAWARPTACAESLEHEARQLLTLDRSEVAACLAEFELHPKLASLWHRVVSCFPQGGRDAGDTTGPASWPCGAFSPTSAGGGTEVCDVYLVPEDISCEGHKSDQWGAVRRLMLAHMQSTDPQAEDGGACSTFDGKLFQVLLGTLQGVAHARSAACLDGLELDACSIDDSDFCMSGLLSIRACFLRLGLRMPPEFARQLPDNVLEGTLRELEVLLQRYDQVPEFLGSSAWPFTYRELYDVIAEWRGVRWQSNSQLTRLAQAALGDIAGWGPSWLREREARDGSMLQLPPRVRVWALGLHAVLLQEPLQLWRLALADSARGEAAGLLEVTTPIRANYCQYVHGVSCEEDPRWTRLLSEHIDSSELDRMGFKNHVVREPWQMRDDVLRAFTGDHAFESADVYLCTEPVLFCTFLNETGKGILGYIGVHIQAYIEAEELPAFHAMFRALVQEPTNTFATSSPQLAQETHWYTGIKLAAITPTSLHIGSVGAWSPNGKHFQRVLLPNRITGWDRARVLNEFMGRWNLFARPHAPCGLQFVEFTSNDHWGKEGRTYASYAQCRAAAFFPKAPNQMLFWDFYALGLPLFVPDAHELLPLYFAKAEPGWVISRWTGDPHGVQTPEFTTGTAYNVTLWDAWRAKTLLSDYASAPHVQTFRSIADLFRQLCGTPVNELQRISAEMKNHHWEHTQIAVAFWREALFVALGSFNSEPSAGPKVEVARDLPTELTAAFARFDLARERQQICEALGIEKVADFELLDESDLDLMPQPLLAVPRKKFLKMLVAYGGGCRASGGCATLEGPSHTS